jgi:hypothetical protein
MTHRALALAATLLLSVGLLATPPAVAAERAAAAKGKAAKSKAAKPKAAKPKAAKPKARTTAESRPVSSGDAWRIKTRTGPVWVYAPPGYDRKTAGVVVYVHGYNITADDAWARHDLAGQFKDSRQNALFVVPEAPQGNGESPKWGSVAALLGAVKAGGIRVPGGPVVAVAHSGGYRSVVPWLRERRLVQVILLDALYGKVDAFTAFARSPGKRLTLVGEDTKRQCEQLLAHFKRAPRLPRIPESVGEFAASARRARVLYLASQYSHGALAEGRKVIPLLLRLSPLRARTG